MSWAGSLTRGKKFEMFTLSRPESTWASAIKSKLLQFSNILQDTTISSLATILTETFSATNTWNWFWQHNQWKWEKFCSTVTITIGARDIIVLDASQMHCNILRRSSIRHVIFGMVTLFTCGKFLLWKWEKLSIRGVRAKAKNGKALRNRPWTLESTFLNNFWCTKTRSPVTCCHKISFVPDE
jgi:hypothetical protein